MPHQIINTTTNTTDQAFKNSSSNTLFGKCELGVLLGCGTFAKVYQGRNVRTGQIVAVKVINKKKLANPALAENIKREITVMRRLRLHPNIIYLHEVLATRSKVYFVMDLIKGGELFDRVSSSHFSEGLCRKYFRQLIFAVGYCHSRGVYHRDLKPENLLIGEKGDLKVGDFGLSAVKEQHHTDGLLHTLCGTPAYVAPEILKKQGYDGAKVDVWSCGVILYVLAAGCLPFNDTNLYNMFKKIHKGEFECPKWMSDDLKRLVARLLDTNPNTRITIDEITMDPWFTEGLDSEVNFHQECNRLNKEEECDVLDDKKPISQDKSKGSIPQTLNAFDLISFSPSLDLSGFFKESRETVEAGERFVSEAPAKEIIERIEGAARAERLRVSKKGKKRKQKEVGVELERQNGCFVAKVEISRLTDQLVVVEVARKVGEERSYDEMWLKKLRPELEDLVYQNDGPDEITPPPSPPPPHEDDDDDEEN